MVLSEPGEVFLEKTYCAMASEAGVQNWGSVTLGQKSILVRKDTGT